MNLSFILLASSWLFQSPKASYLSTKSNPIYECNFLKQTGHRCSSLVYACQYPLDPFIRHSQYIQCLMAKVWQSSWFTIFMRKCKFYQDYSSSSYYFKFPYPFFRHCSQEMIHMRSLTEPSPQTDFLPNSSSGLSPLQRRILVRMATLQVFFGNFFEKYIFSFAASQQVPSLSGDQIGLKSWRFNFQKVKNFTFIPWKNAFAFFLIFFIAFSLSLQRTVAIQMTSFLTSI